MAPVNKPMTPADGESNMNTGLAVSARELRGPTVTGTVRINLSELDQMRADHAAAVRMAKDLESKAMSVKIVLQERKQYQQLNDRNRWVTDERLEEISVEWRNLEEFRCIIHEEEHKKVADEIAQLQSDVRSKINEIRRLNDNSLGRQQLIDNLSTKSDGFERRCAELNNENDSLTRIQAEHNIETAGLTKQLMEARTLVLEEIKKTDSAKKEVEALKAVNSFGGHMARWFGFWPKQF